MDRRDWDVRYDVEEFVWTAVPNRFLVEEVCRLRPARAVDLACGEGRNAVWLSEQGWKVTGVDFSSVGLAKADRLAKARSVDVTLIESDVLNWTPPRDGYDLVVMLYLQLNRQEREAALRVAASAVASNGTILIVGHDAENLSRGIGGPQDPEYLYRAGEVAAVLVDAGLSVTKAGQVVREMETDAGTRQAIDTLVRGTRPLSSTE